MWPAAFALKELTAAEEARISALVKKSVSRNRVVAGCRFVPVCDSDSLRDGRLRTWSYNGLSFPYMIGSEIQVTRAECKLPVKSDAVSGV